MQHLQPNTTLQGGKYRIERVLGQGGFGITYLACNTVFDIDVAIKEFFMKDENDRDGSSVTMPNTTKQDLFHGQMEKFKKEAKRMFAIKNEHIIGVQDLFEENGTTYYVMDYVDGENLAERLKRTGKPMTEQEVRDFLPQILDALKAVHDAGIWHLDLKPANILIDKNGIVKLIDFGASKQLNTQKGGATTSTAISYTNGYAPREQMEQNYDKFGPWTDIYALGATLYNLLTNNRPPLPTDIDDDVSEDKHFALPFPGSVGGEMKKLVLELMHTNRMQRPQSIGEIQNFLIDSPLESKSIAVKEDEETIIANPEKEEIVRNKNALELNNHDSNVKKNKRSNKKILWGLAACLLLLLLILSGFYYSSRNVKTELVQDVDSIPEVIDESIDSASIFHRVERMNFESALGGCQYTGYVDENNLPVDIRGKAFFNDGRYYKGGFNHGLLEGEDVYFKYPEGDVFEGEFRNNSFYKGKYTVKEDGSYFKGTFKNGLPDKGNWFDKNGKVIQ